MPETLKKQKFVPGDVVCLRSGSPDMVVSSYSDVIKGSVRCYLWCPMRHKLHDFFLKEDVLEKKNRRNHNE